MASLLPTPEPADPVEGQPGHFTHTNWVKQSLKNLDVGTVHTDQVAGLYGRNRIINGDFSVNQRVFSSSTVSVYGFDRWACLGVGGTITYSSQLPAFGELPESARAYARVVTAGQAAAGDYTQFTQPIEFVKTLSGKVVTVSFWARAASGTPKVAVELRQYYGSGGSPANVLTYAGQVTLSTAWTRYSVTVLNPAIVAGSTVGAGESMSVNLFTSAGSTFASRTGSIGIQNTSIDFWGVQAEEGAYATPFEQKSYADELRACQRYFYRRQYGVDQVSESGYAGASSTAYYPMRHPVPMRVAPVLASVIGTYYGCYPPGLLTTGGLFTNLLISNVAYSGPTSTVITGTGATGLSVSVPVMLYCLSGGGLDFNAEL